MGIVQRVSMKPNLMIDESAELVAVATRWVDAMNRRDFATVANLFLRSGHGRYVGTDAHEWWQGVDYIEAYAAHQEELPAFFIDVQEVEGFAVGEFGWAAVRTLISFEGGESRSARFTFVFLLDSGFWRIIQTHSSFAVPNPDVLGVEMTRSLTDLLASIGPGIGTDLATRVREGTVTLVFTDVEGSTELARQLGDERWANIIEWHDSTVRKIVEEHGGIVVKTLGDGAMAAFESVREAARSAIAVQQAFSERTDTPVLLVRVGLHVGDAVFTEDDYMGNTVNKAARIAAAAAGGEIVASTAARSLLQDDPEFQFGDTRTVHLKGLDGLHEVAQLKARRSPDTGP